VSNGRVAAAAVARVAQRPLSQNRTCAQPQQSSSAYSPHITREHCPSAAAVAATRLDRTRPRSQVYVEAG